MQAGGGNLREEGQEKMKPAKVLGVTLQIIEERMSSSSTIITAAYHLRKCAHKIWDEFIVDGGIDIKDIEALGIDKTLRKLEILESVDDEYGSASIYRGLTKDIV